MDNNKKRNMDNSSRKNNSNSQEQDNEYFAFISYKHKDAELALWLQRKLENYHLPSKIIKEHPELPKKVQETSQIRPRLFRDVTELGGGPLPQNIEYALENSGYLIVICSQESAKSEWVDKEIQGFIKMGKVKKIIPFIIDGKPYDTQNECYPKSLQSLKGSEEEPIGININDLGRDAAAVKVIATMLELKFDTLWQRHLRDKAKRQGIYATIAVVAFFVLTGFLIWLYHNNRELESRSWKIKENQARYIAGRVNQLIDEDDACTARFILSKVLPQNLDNPDYPYTVEAEAALRKAWSCRSSILNGHTWNLWTSEFSPDGKQIVTASGDNTVRVWDAASGEQLLVLTGHKDQVRAASFSPNGKEIASLSWDNVIKVWDSRTGELKNTYTGDNNTASSLSYSPDGKRIVVGNGNGYIIIRDAKSGNVVSSFKGHEGRVWSVHYSHNGHHLVSSSNDGLIKIWNTETTKVERVYKDHIRYAPYSTNTVISPYDNIPETTDIWHVSFSPDDTSVIYVSDSTFVVLDAKSGKETMRVKGHAGLLTKAKFSHDGERIVSSSDDNTVKIWDAKTGKIIKTYNGHKGTVWDVNFSPDDKMIVSSSNDNSARIWDLERNKPSEIFRTNNGPIRYFAFGGRTFPDYNQVEFAIFAPDDKSIIFEDHGIKTYNFKEGTIQIADTANYYGKIESQMFSPNGKYLVNSSGNKIMILNTQNYHKEKEFISELYADKTNFTNDGKNVIAITKSSYELWDWAKGTCLSGSSFGSTYHVTAISSKGYIATSKEDTLDIWNAQTGEKEKELINDQHKIEKIVFSPTGKYLACSSNKVTATIWEVSTGKKIQTIYGYSEHINSMTFNPQENLLMTAARDGSVKIWDVKSGVLLSEYDGDDGSACYASFNNSGEKIVVGYGKEVVKIWDFPSLQNLINRTNFLFQNRELTQEEKDKFHLE